jgi:hypothetical protein
VYAGGDPVNFLDPQGLSFLAKAISAVKGCIEGAVKGPEFIPGGPVVRKVGRVIVRIPVPQSKAAVAATGCAEGAAKSLL